MTVAEIARRRSMRSSRRRTSMGPPTRYNAAHAPLWRSAALCDLSPKLGAGPQRELELEARVRVVERRAEALAQPAEAVAHGLRVHAEAGRRGDGIGRGPWRG